uniref:F-box domain-containing protein n=1 Tax=Mycena chlorophos TaxID=658473 RepID=A0ABQ0LC01_MYCCL|nr:predicted protein [Mycena chlorophos]
MATRIPSELIDAIVEHIPDDASLRSCCLAASIFRSPCQKRLFHSLSLHLPSGGGTSDRKPFHALAKRFEENPHLASLVKHLSLYFPAIRRPIFFGTVGDPTVYRSDPPRPELYHQSGTVDVVRAVFKHLENVEQVHIGSSGGDSWNALPLQLEPVVLDWLIRCGNNRNLSQLTIQGINDIPEAALPILLHAARVLFLWSCELEPKAQLEDSESICRVALQAPANLKQLEIDGSRSTLVRSTAPGAKDLVSHLTYLSLVTFEIHRDFFESLVKLCACSSETLECLQLWIMRGINAEHKALVESQFTKTLPHLQHFMMHSGLPSSPDHDLWILQTIISPVVAPSLTKITVILSKEEADPAGDNALGRFRFDRDATWALRALYDEFAAGHPTLQQICWHPRMYRYGQPEEEERRDFDEFCAGMRAAMPRAHAKGLLGFERAF